MSVAINCESYYRNTQITSRRFVGGRVGWYEEPAPPEDVHMNTHYAGESGSEVHDKHAADAHSEPVVEKS